MQLVATSAKTRDRMAATGLLLEFTPPNSSRRLSSQSLARSDPRPLTSMALPGLEQQPAANHYRDCKTSHRF